MTRLDPIPLQFELPLFVRKPFRARGRDWKKNQEFKWKEMSVDRNKVIILYREGFLIHSSELENKMQVGDGLEALDIVGLHSIVDSYNQRLSKLNLNKTTFEQRKAKKSTLADKQRGLIRSWRRNQEDWLNKAEANKKG